MGKTQILILSILGVIVVAVLFVNLGLPFVAHGATSGGSASNPISTFFNDLFNPLPSQQGSSATVGNGTNNAPAPLYQSTDQYENDVVNSVKAASPAVVSITISENVPIVENCPYDPYDNLPSQFQQFFGGDFGGLPTSTPCTTGKTQLQQVGGGSGFIISSDGLILTNKHVVSQTNAQYSVLTNDGKTYTAKVLARDPNQDLAVLKIDATGLPTVTLGNSDSLELGQTAIAIGNALGQFSNTVSVGVVSGLGRTVTATAPDTGTQETISGVIQTDAAINPGNSGGPLLNLQGQVIGIDTAVASDAQNIGFAIPINEAKSAIRSVEANGTIQAPYLGVRYEDVTPAIAKQDSLPITYGAYVNGGGQGSAVEANSPASAAGVQAKDIIESVDSIKLDSTHDLGNVINEYGVGSVVTLVVNRGGKEVTLQVTLAQRPTGK